MILCINNFLESATITVNQGNNLFPAENLYSPTLHGEEGVCAYTDNIVIDLITAKQITAIGILRTSASVTVEANNTDSWSTPAYSINMDEDVKIINETYRYWRVKTAESGLQYIGQFYLGIPLSADYAQAGSVPSVQVSDVENTGATGRWFATKGIEKFIQSFTVSTASEVEYTEWYNYYVSDERIKPCIFTQYEETQGGIYPAYFARVKFQADGRDRLNYRFNFDLMEVT